MTKGLRRLFANIRFPCENLYCKWVKFSFGLHLWKSKHFTSLWQEYPSLYTQFHKLHLCKSPHQSKIITTPVKVDNYHTLYLLSLHYIKTTKFPIIFWSWIFQSQYFCRLLNLSHQPYSSVS